MIRRWVLMAFLAGAAPVHAVMVWSGQAPVASERAAQHGGHAEHDAAPQRGRGGVYLLQGEGAQAEFWLPTLQRDALPVTAGRAGVKPSGMDNYHLLLAVRESAQRHESALRYHYMRGRPSKRSPSELLAVPKVPLEIVPAPLTREHQRYLAGTVWHFVLRFEGEPLAGAPITLATSHGTHLTVVSDAVGRVSFTLPDDFAQVQAGRRNNPPAEFVLHAMHSSQGREYQTSLSAAYHANPRHWQSLDGGVWAGLLGFVVGLGLIRLTTKKDNKA